MRQIQTIMKLWGVAAVALSAFVFNAQAANDNKKLKGDWTQITTRTCIRSNAGFGPNLEALGPTFRTQSTFRTTVTFDGVGSGTSSGEGIAVSMNNLAAGVQQIGKFLSTCTFTYSVNPDRSFIMQNITCNAQVIEGSGAGASITTTRPTQFGRFDKKANTYIRSDTGTTVETLNFTLATGVVFTSDQICTRHTTAIKH